MLLWTTVREGSKPIGSDSVLGVYTHVPPTWSSLSKTTTLWPSCRSSRAAASPPAPAPMTATFRRCIRGKKRRFGVGMMVMTAVMTITKFSLLYFILAAKMSTSVIT